MIIKNKQIMLCTLSFLVIFLWSSISAAIEVTPTDLYFSLPKRNSFVTVTNTSEHHLVMNIGIEKVVSKTDHSLREASHDFIVTPALFSIPPKSQQIVRFGLRRPLDPKSEHYYRLLIKENETSSSQAKDDIKRKDGKTIILFAINLPLRVKPAEVNKSMTTQIISSSEGITLSFDNTGNGYEFLKKIRIYSKKDQKLLKEQASHYFLAPNTKFTLEVTLPEESRNLPEGYTVDIQGLS